jgi:RHS repeat-associated protein
LPPESKHLGVPPCTYCIGVVGNPINADVGNKVEIVTDYESAGPQKLSFIRAYNSGGMYVSRITDPGQTVAWDIALAPFGGVAQLTPSLIDNLRFPGQYADAETGLNYNYFRDYDPSIGRYVESDPIGLEGGVNTYGYVGSRPLDWTDPLGLDACRRGTPPLPKRDRGPPKPLQCMVECGIVTIPLCLPFLRGGPLVAGGCLLIRFVICDTNCSPAEGKKD